MDNTESMLYAIYARYSSDLQRPTSIEDQIRKCTEFGQAKGWSLANGCVYTDQAISGVSTERPGLNRMLQAAFSEHRPFEAILIDDTSRLSRDQSDAIRLYQRLDFVGVRIIAVAQGIDSKNEEADVLVWVAAFRDSMDVKSISKKTHRAWKAPSCAVSTRAAGATVIAMLPLKAVGQDQSSRTERLPLSDAFSRCLRVGFL